MNKISVYKIKELQHLTVKDIDISTYFSTKYSLTSITVENWKGMARNMENTWYLPDIQDSLMSMLENLPNMIPV